MAFENGMKPLLTNEYLITKPYINYAIMETRL
jgi:hypothetical protein